MSGMRGRARDHGTKVARTARRRPVSARSISISTCTFVGGDGDFARRAKHLHPGSRDFGFDDVREGRQVRQNHVRLKSKFASNLNTRHSVQPSPAKIFCFPSVYQQRILTPSTPPKGRSALVTDAELDAMATRDVTDEGCRRGRSSRVVLIPRRWDQAAQWRRRPYGPTRRDCAAMVANKPGTPGRARSSRNTIAQGMPE